MDLSTHISSLPPACPTHVTRAQTAAHQQFMDEVHAHFATINWIPHIPDREIRAVAMYHAAQRAPLPLMVLGLRDMRRLDSPNSRALIANFGTLSEQHHLDPTNLPQDVKAALFLMGSSYRDSLRLHGTEGGILREQPNNWWPGLNDMVMFGAISVGKDFAIGIAKEQFDPARHLWDRKWNRPSCLGRELLFLYGAGYMRVAPAPGHEGDYVFALTAHQLSVNATTLRISHMTRWASEVTSPDHMQRIWLELSASVIGDKDAHVAPSVTHLSPR